MLRTADAPVSLLRDYLLKSGTYPRDVSVSTPAGPLSVRLYSPHDLLTLNEIFFRRDYAVRNSARIHTVVDFGSNIGISAAYFLTHHPQANLYLYEPWPQNIERLKHNLAAFIQRYQLTEEAVSLEAGTAEFGYEATGRYGGLGRSTGQSMLINCVSATTVLEQIIERHGSIDLLKIDIETLEQEIVASLSPIADKIHTIFVESRFHSNPLAETHTTTVRGGISCFERLRHQHDRVSRR
jgi:FkbM family methyltransferase